MPQIMIDTNVETTETLRDFANFLLQWADKVDAVERGVSSARLETRVMAYPDPIPPPPVAPAPGAEHPPRPATVPPPPPTDVPPPPPAEDVYDLAGTPWDARIHSSNRSTNENGTWRKRKKLDPAFLSMVEKELAPRMRIPTPPPTPVIPPPPPAADPEAASLFQNNPPPSTVVQFPGSAQNNGSLATGFQTPAAVIPPPPAPSSPQVSPPPPPTTGVQPLSFKTLMQKVTQNLQAGKLTNEDVKAACETAGIGGLQNLVSQPMYLQSVADYLDAVLASR